MGYSHEKKLKFLHPLKYYLQFFMDSKTISTKEKIIIFATEGKRQAFGYMLKFQFASRPLNKKQLANNNFITKKSIENGYRRRQEKA